MKPLRGEKVNLLGSCVLVKEIKFFRCTYETIAGFMFAFIPRVK